MVKQNRCLDSTYMPLDQMYKRQKGQGICRMDYKEVVKEVKPRDTDWKKKHRLTKNIRATVRRGE
jgi:hypothetical protein